MNDDKPPQLGGPVRLIIDNEEPAPAVRMASAAAVAQPSVRRNAASLSAVAGKPQQRGKGGGEGGSDADQAEADRSEIELARAFASEHAEDRRYVPGLSWLCYDAGVWHEEKEALRVRRDIDAICCEKAQDYKGNIAIDLKSNATVSAVERLARHAPSLAASEEDFDRDPHLLNTPDGVIDLREGVDSLRGHQASDMMRKMTAVTPSDDSRANWINLVNHLTNGDAELRDYLWRACGYMATGLTHEQVFFFLTGVGGSGKSKFVNALEGVMGSYATHGAENLFLEPRGERHPTDLAAVAGFRLVTATEIDQGRYWYESRLKQVVAGDPVSARFMRQDNFTFTPICKLLIAGNHRPHMRDTGESMRRRLHLVEAPVKVPDDKRDLELAEKLRAEFPGILQWIVSGAVQYFKRGLQPPAAVRTAVDEYFREDDIVSQWLDERCVRESAERIGVLHADFLPFAERNHVPPMGINALSGNLASKGFTRKRGTGGVAIMLGLRLMTDEERRHRLQPDQPSLNV